MNCSLEINRRVIGPGRPVYIIAEMSANHNQHFEHAIQILEAAKKAGADAVKLQTYTPDTLTIDVRNCYFKIDNGTPWKDRYLYDLYNQAYMPWEWQPKLKRAADELGIHLFSSPFDETAVDFLESMDVSAYKVASFEIVDIPLLKSIARTNKPILMSTGLASVQEIDEAISAVQKVSKSPIALLKCTSSYPAPPERMNLNAIPWLRKKFGLPIGLSDHTNGYIVPVVAVSLGACIIEKHITLSRSDTSPDSTFSLEPEEFTNMVQAIRLTEKALGEYPYETIPDEGNSRMFRRSLFVVRDVKEGETFNDENVRSIRPGYGLHTRYFEGVLGKSASKDIKKGTPFNWSMIEKKENESGESRPDGDSK